MIYFTSDNHFFHDNILEFEPKRKEKFGNMANMCQDFVNTIKEQTQKGDTIMCLGDFSLGSKYQTLSLMDKLPRRQWELIKGNHDCKSSYKGKASKFWHSVWDIRQLWYNHQFFVCCHYPILSWQKQSKGSYMISRHTHGRLNKINESCRRIDIGYDSIGKWIISIEEIIEILSVRSGKREF